MPRAIQRQQNNQKQPKAAKILKKKKKYLFRERKLIHAKES